MGIPSYFSYILRKKRKTIGHGKLPNNIDVVLMDCNSIIYDVIRRLDVKEGDTIDKLCDVISLGVFEYISSFLSLVDPNKNAVITFDGMCPKAKMHQQRLRRYKSSVYSELREKILKDENTQSLDMTMITPGTPFMTNLMISLASQVEELKSHVTYDITFSGSDEYGEGEHKMFEWVRKRSSKLKNSNVCVYGLDADLIVLSLHHVHSVKNIFMLREMPEYMMEKEGITCYNDGKSHVDTMYNLDIRELSISIVSELCDISLKDVVSQSRYVRKCNMSDYTFLTFLLGNDFLPHFPSLNLRSNGIQVLIDTYKSCFPTPQDTIITYDNTSHEPNINWLYVNRLFEALTINESQRFIDETENNIQQYNGFSRQMNEAFDDLTSNNNIGNVKQFIQCVYDTLPSSNKNIEQYVYPSKNGWQFRYYEMLFDMNEINMNDEYTKQLYNNTKRNIVEDYCRTLEWCMYYYSHHCIDFQHVYHYPHPPLFEDLYKHTQHLREKRHTFFEKHSNNNNKQNNKPRYHHYTQLSYVLPSTNVRNAVSDDVIKQLRNKQPSLFTEFKMSTCYNRYEWENHGWIPDVNLDDVNNEIKSCI